MENTYITTGDSMLVNSDSIGTVTNAVDLSATTIATFVPEEKACNNCQYDSESIVRINLNIRKKAKEVSLEDYALFMRLAELASSSGFEVSDSSISKNTW